MQRLRAAEHPRERLDRGADDVHLRLLRGERNPRGLGVEAQLHRPLALAPYLSLEPPRPDSPCRAVLRDLLEEVDVRVEEEREPRRERVDREARLHRELDVGEPVRKRERGLLGGSRARLADVVARDRDRVPTRHVGCCKRDGVAHEPHRRTGREHELLLRLVFLQDVVLQRAAEPRAIDARPLGLSDEHREDHRCWRIDRHRRGDLAEIDARVEVLHVGKRVDRHAAAPDLAERHRVVRVDAQQRRHVERRRETIASCLDDLLEPPVGVVRGAEAREHPHRPELRSVHRCIGAAGVGILTWERTVVGAVHPVERDARHRREVGVAQLRLGVRLFPQLAVRRHERTIL